MKYPNAYAGIKKIYASQILAFIATVLTVAGVTVGAVVREIGTVTVAFAVPFAVLLVAGGVLNVISYIKHIRGANLCAKDVPAFRKALVWLIIGVVVSIVKNVLESTDLEALVLMMRVIFTLSNFLGAYFTVCGIIEMAAAEQNYAFKAQADAALRQIILTKVLGLIGTGADYIVNEFFSTAQSGFMHFLPYILMAFTLLMDILFYLFFLRILKRTKHELEQI